MTRHIVCSTPTLSLRWIRRGDERVLQQCFAVATIDNKTGQAASNHEWVDVPTFMEVTQEPIPALPSVKIEVKRDRMHIEGLIDQLIAKLESAQKAGLCPCGDDDGNWCSLPGCPYPHPGTATKSSGAPDE